MSELNPNPKRLLLRSSLILISVLILFAYLISMISGTLTLISVGIALILLAYFYYRLLFRAERPMERTGTLNFPSVYITVQAVLPLLFGFLALYEGIKELQAFSIAIIASGLTLTFLYNFFAVPLAIYHKFRELKDIAKPIPLYPSVSIIVPAYNEEKVIARTIDALIEADYPNKEIIIVDDGSTDRTLSIALGYKKYGVKVYHKENSGKWSAINYGLKFARGEIIVVIDADSIVGRDALKELVKGFSDPNVVAVCGNVKVLNRVNWITKCQALEYITGINIFRRALDMVGAVPVVPGALGAFKKKALETVGLYDRDTIVEDFDITIKLLKSGNIVLASSYACVYTEAPQTLKDLYRQRMRWYRGNFQVLIKHLDSLLNPRYGVLHRLTMPYVLSSMVFLPLAGIVIWVSAIYSILIGAWLPVLKLFMIFVILQALLSFLAIDIDEEDLSLVAYSPFFVIGFKHIIDFLLLKAFFDVVILRRHVVWTRARRIGLG